MAHPQGEPDFAAAIAAVGEQTGVMLISTHSEEELEELVAAAPAVGFLPKSRLTAEAVVSLLRGT